jgi:hypothetical protein
MTDNAVLGVVYRAKADVDLEGDLAFCNLMIDRKRLTI